MFDEIVEEVEGAHTDEAQSQTLANVDQLTFEQAHGLYMQAVETKILDLHTDPNVNLEDIQLRSSTAVRLQWLRQKTMAIVGVGGIGNWVWRMAAALGVNKIIVIDNDQVEIQNVGPQFYNLTDLGRHKVDVVRDNMLMFAGTEMSAVCARVASYEHLRTLCGGTPDILVTAVDNMDFRNRINADIHGVLRAGTTSGYLPELYFDLRMSLGDWTAYMLPLTYLSRTRRGLAIFEDNFLHAGAVFPQDDSVQEACTERAIVYTGANLASYVCAAIHWYANDGRVLLQESEEAGQVNLARFMSPDSAWEHTFSAQTTFSSRDWLQVTSTPTTRALNKRIARIEDDYAAMEFRMVDARREYEARIAELERQLASGNGDHTVEEAAQPARACVRPRQQPENAQLALHQVEQGYVLVFPEYRVFVDEVNNTFLRGVNLEDGGAERITGRAMSGLTTWYLTYEDYLEGPDYDGDYEIDPYDRPTLESPPNEPQPEGGPQEPLDGRRAFRRDLIRHPELLYTNTTPSPINLEALFGPTIMDAQVTEVPAHLRRDIRATFDDGTPTMRQQVDEETRLIMEVLDAQGIRPGETAQRFNPAEAMAAVLENARRGMLNNAGATGLNVPTATPDDIDVAL